MDKILYDYLINNNKKLTSLSNDFNDNNQIFLESLLILSINKIYINYNNLIEYCYNIINNNKVNKSHDVDIYYGLNEKQFQILYKILKELKNDKASVDQLVYNHRITLGGINKFDCSIIIIIENNLQLLKPQNEICTKLDNIKNGSECEDDYNYVLFKKVWNNLVIRNEIKLHIKLFNIHLNNGYSQNFNIDLEKFSNYKYKNYIRSLGIPNKGLIKFTSKHCKLISSSLDELYLTGIKIFENNSIPSTISKLELGDNFNQKLTKNLYHNYNGNGNAVGENITELVFGNNFNRSLSVCVKNNKNEKEDQAWLPRNLTSLRFGKSFQRSIHPGQLPNSLTSLEFDDKYQGTILPNSIPKSVTTLKFDIDSFEDDIKLKNIPKSTTNLILSYGFNEDIKVGDIPHNVTSLTFGGKFNRNIAPGSLPQSIRSLKFGFEFNKQIDYGILLTSLSFGRCYNQPFIIENNRIFIPNSVIHLSFGSNFNQTIGVNALSMLENLKTLITTDCYEKTKGCIIEPFSLPNTITTLDLRGYYGKIDGNRLPTSLTSLSLQYNDNLTTTPPNTLPQSITTLHIYGTFNQPIQSILNLIPPNLKSIYLHGSYHYDLTLIDWPKSLESIYIPFGVSTFNSLPTQFFNNFIKIFK